jgi:hypothetical protein
MTCNDCGRDIDHCDRYGCRETNGTAWGRPQSIPRQKVPDLMRIRGMYERGEITRLEGESMLREIGI